MTITKAQAGREINRRKGVLPKGVTVHEARARAVREGTFGLQKPELKAIAGRAKAQVSAAKADAPKAPAPKAKAPVCPVRKGAQEAFQAAFDAAPDGQRQKAGRKAYGEYRKVIEALAG